MFTDAADAVETEPRVLPASKPLVRLLRNALPLLPSAPRLLPLSVERRLPAPTGKTKWPDRIDIRNACNETRFCHGWVSAVSAVSEGRNRVASGPLRLQSAQQEIVGRGLEWCH